MIPQKLSESLSLPAIAAPMFLISGPDLVVECCKNGVVGTFPALNQRSTEGFEQWLVEIENRLAGYTQPNGKPAAPYGVNLIVHRSNPRLYADVEMIVKHKVPVVITSLGAVSDIVNAVHSYGGLVFHDVINQRHAEKANEAGVDGLILVCAGAGGHAGTLHPMAFVNEIRSFFKKTILLSGCISTGRDIASALQIGADLAYMGTRFINTTESRADKEYQEMIIESDTADIVYTAAVSGVNANFLKPSLEAAGLTPELWSKAGKIDFGKELDAAQAEAKAWKTIWSAGQGVTSIHDVQSTQSLIDNLKQEFRSAIEEQYQLLQKY
ncbi:nitronate monooxygenase family protein [Emticicia oligotrophica]|uniref:NAD(P)H-dependent flavin oxidoreductase n=1 Tax=Emticicia oligotrophica TaxID=312279 RepID=UPI00273C2673|nr:nitronate monooxygenase family protein [Emticicia oligotrophica]